MKLPEDLKHELAQLVFWAIVFGVVLGFIVLVDELKPLVGL